MTPEAKAIEVLTYLNDIRLPLGDKKRSLGIEYHQRQFNPDFRCYPRRLKRTPAACYADIDWATRKALRAPQGKEKILVINASKFPPEGDDCDARLIVAAYQSGLETVYRLWLQRTAFYRLRSVARIRTACASMSMTAPAIIWPPVSTDWKFMFTAMPRTR